MTRVSINLIFRSQTQITIRPGVVDYTYVESKLLPADVLASQGYTFDNDQSINMDVKQNVKLSFIMSNDSTDRLNRLTHVLYLGTLYEINTVEIARPRVIITLGGTATSSLQDLLSVGKEED